MNRFLRSFAGIVAVSLFFLCSMNAQKVVSLDSEWKFSKGDTPDAETRKFDDTDWRTVTVPHDWAIEGPFDAMLPANTGKLPWKDVAWYRKSFNLANDLNGKTLYLMFDGVMAFPEVYVNGKLAGNWDYGYNSFYLNITDLVNFKSENLLAVRVDTREFDSRWYPGAGIYRKVRLIAHDPIHFEPWGVYVQTPSVAKDSALIHTYLTVVNDYVEPDYFEIETTVISPEGKVVATHTFDADVPAGSKQTFENWLTIDDPMLWDIDHPYRYQMKTIIKKGGEIVQQEWTKFGLRNFYFTADDGFWLNGRRVQLKGVNLHHDHGPLGAKFYDRAMERQLEIMMSMGVNAIRNSHNVAAPELLEMCDSLGLIFFNEVFDKWDAKAGYLPGMDFEEFAGRNISNWVRRDRNHPSVMLWSVGNEMGDIQYNIDGGFDKLNLMLALVKTIRSDTTGNYGLRCQRFGSVAPFRFLRRACVELRKAVPTSKAPGAEEVCHHF